MDNDKHTTDDISDSANTNRSRSPPKPIAANNRNNNGNEHNTDTISSTTSITSTVNNANTTHTTPDFKRQKSLLNETALPSSPIAMALFPNGMVAASPPRFVSLEEIMHAANGVENMILAHEIAVDTNFKLEKVDTTPINSIEKRVKEVMNKAFWDILESQLNESPPNYKQAMVLLKEIRDSIQSLLLPQHTRLQQEIEEILDLELILQQAENGILDFQRYAQYVLSVCARLCAPVRDEQIRELTQTRDVVPLFRGIFELLDVMRLDMANFHIQQMRPHIQQKSIEYERQKFKELLDNQSKVSAFDGLEFTRVWLKRNYETLDLSNETNTQNVMNNLLTNAYLELLLWTDSKQELYPETLLLDAIRFNTLRAKVSKLTLVGSVFLVTYATVGQAIQGLQEFLDTLKQHLFLLITENNSKTVDELKNEMISVSLQVISEVQKCLEKHGFSALDSNKCELLKTQIADIAKEENRVRKVLERRILEFVEGVLVSPTAAPMQIPSGLSNLQKELTEIAGQFIRIVAHNRAVFSEYYADIIAELVPGFSRQKHLENGLQT